MRNSRRHFMLSSLVIFAGVVLACGPRTALSYDGNRAAVVDRYLDVGEVAAGAGGVSATASTEEPSAREAYIGQQQRFFVAPPTKKQRHSFNVAYEAYSYDYQEMVNGRKFMNNSGAYSGFDVEYAYRPETKGAFWTEYVDEFRLQGRFAAGEVDYTGSGTYSGLKDSMYEVRGLMAKNYDLKDGVTAVPYIGLGYRYLNDGLQEYTPGGYNRESTYFYLPAGGDLRARVRGGWDLTMNLEYDQLLNGKQKSHLEDFDSRLDTLVNTQRKGYGLRGSFKVSKDLSKKLSMYVEPFFRYWDIENSDISPFTSLGEPVLLCDGSGCSDSGQEPSNVTKEVGLRMGMGF